MIAERWQRNRATGWRRTARIALAVAAVSTVLRVPEVAPGAILYWAFTTVWWRLGDPK